VKAEAGRGQVVERPPYHSVQQSLSSWKALTTPKPVERSAANMPAGV
jgi:dihydropyrimidinase